MRYRLLRSIGVVAAVALVSVTMGRVNGQAQTSTPAGQPAATPQPADAPQTPWGEPDLQGIWSVELLVPLERPAGVTTQFYTDEEVAELDGQRAGFSVFGNHLRAEPGSEADVAGAYNEVYTSLRPTSRRTGMIVDPPDGKMPPITPAAQELQAAMREYQQALLQNTTVCRDNLPGCRGGTYGPPSPRRAEPPPYYSTRNVNRLHRVQCALRLGSMQCAHALIRKRDRSQVAALTRLLRCGVAGGDVQLVAYYMHPVRHQHIVVRKPDIKGTVLQRIDLAETRIGYVDRAVLTYGHVIQVDLIPFHDMLGHNLSGIEIDFKKRVLVRHIQDIPAERNALRGGQIAHPHGIYHHPVRGYLGYGARPLEIDIRHVQHVSSRIVDHRFGSIKPLFEEPYFREYDRCRLLLGRRSILGSRLAPDDEYGQQYKNEGEGSAPGNEVSVQ